MSNIHLRGGFVKRLDAFMIAIWFFTLFALVGVFLFYAEKILYQLLPGRENEKVSEKQKGGMDWKKWGTLGGVLVLTFLVAEWFYHGNLTEWYIAYMRWLGVPFLGKWDCACALLCRNHAAYRLRCYGIGRPVLSDDGGGGQRQYTYFILLWIPGIEPER